MVELLEESGTVYLVAQRRSFPVAFYLHYALSHLGKPAQLLDSLGGMLSEQGKVMKQGDALFAVSFPPYAPQVLNLVKEASLENIKIIQGLYSYVGHYIRLLVLGGDPWFA